MLVGEELNWGCSGIATSIGANGLGAGPVILFGSDEQKATWLPPLLESPVLCCFGLSEPGAGSDVAALKTTAVRDGDDYVLNGSKTFITNAGYAAWCVVFAKTDPKARAQGHVRVHRPDGHARSDAREAPRQDGPALRPTPPRSRSRTSASRPRT